MENFPSNSREPRREAEDNPEEKRILKVVDGTVARRKKPLGKRFSDIFLGGDSKSVIDYIIHDVLVPAAKDMVADAVSQGIERMIFGDSRPASRRSSSRTTSTTGPVNYTRYTAKTAPSPRTEGTYGLGASRRGRVHDFDEIILNSRAEADEVIDQMYDLLSKYETVSVSDLYELVGVNGSYTDEKWGWTHLRGAGVSRVSSGYLLNLPKTEPLD